MRKSPAIGPLRVTEQMNTSNWREGDGCKGIRTNLNIDTFALFDWSAIFACSADLRDVTFAGGHSVRRYLKRADCRAWEGGGRREEGGGRKEELRIEVMKFNECVVRFLSREGTK